MAGNILQLARIKPLADLFRSEGFTIEGEQKRYGNTMKTRTKFLDPSGVGREHISYRTINPNPTKKVTTTFGTGKHARTTVQTISTRPVRTTRPVKKTTQKVKKK